MLLRAVWAEAIDLAGRPAYWIGIFLVSLLVLVGVDQLALDVSTVKILVIDNSPKQLEGVQIVSLIKELSGLEATLPTDTSISDQKIDDARADIIIHKVNDLWHATLRPRSILEHRRLSRLGFSLASVINHVTPWDTVMSAESMSPRNYGNAICMLGERMCSVLSAIGHPQFSEICVKPDEYKPTPTYAFEDGERACPGTTGPVIRDALNLEYRLGNFCDGNLVDEGRSKGLCNTAKTPIVSSVVSMLSAPQSHTKVFIPKTICLLAVFVAFMICCRSWIQETRYNTWPVLAAASHGSIKGLLAAKVLTASVFALFLVVVLLEFSSWRFGINIKPGLLVSLLPVFIATVSSAMLGLAVALIVRSEVTAYVVASLYLLILFVLSGYIDELKDSASIVSAVAYVVPLRYVITPFSTWMTFGNTLPLNESLASLLSQCTGSLGLLLIAAQVHQRRS